MKNSAARLVLLVSLMSALPSGCHEPTLVCFAASSISRNGFAMNATEMRHIDGQEIAMWGFIDHGNLYGDEAAKAILQEWWSGFGPDDKNWRFDLKAHANDPIGSSFAVRVANDPGRDVLLNAFLADARAGKPTPVLVKGRVYRFNAPINATVLTGLFLQVTSSQNIMVRAKCDAFSEHPNLSD